MQDLNKRQGLALLSKVGESVKHVAGGYKLRARPAEFGAMGDYLDTFSQKLGTIDRIAQRILKEQSGSAPPGGTAGPKRGHLKNNNINVERNRCWSLSCHLSPRQST